MILVILYRYSYGAKQKRFNQNLSSYLPSFGRRKQQQNANNNNNISNKPKDSSISPTRTKYGSDQSLNKTDKLANGSVPHGGHYSNVVKKDSVGRMLNGGVGGHYGGHNHGAGALGGGHGHGHLPPSPPQQPPIQVKKNHQECYVWKRG